MYRQHFGFSKRPFDSGIARDGDVYVGPAQRAALANLAVALSTLDSIAVLTGPPGVGKTTLASAALRAESARIALGWLGTVPADPHDLPDLLLAEFGLAAPGAGRVERLQIWRQFLSEMGATESRVLVIVEHADDLAPPVLRALESLTAADPNGCPGANVVLTGQAPLQALLDAPALQALRQRVRLRQALEALTSEETERYLHHRIECAGGRAGELLTPHAVAALQSYSGGIPRVLNNLCESALALAASRSERLLEPALIVHVAEELFGLSSAGTASPASELSARDTATPASDDPAADVDVPVLTDAVEVVEEPARSRADVALLTTCGSRRCVRRSGARRSCPSRSRQTRSLASASRTWTSSRPPH